jgi:hypothetical protein
MFQRSRFVLEVAITLTMISIIFILFAKQTLWIGSFDLTVHLRSSNGVKIKSVLFHVGRQRPGQDRVEQYVWDDLRKADEVDESVVVIPVKCTGRDDVWGRQQSYGQEDLALLQVEFEGGSIVRKLVEIPDGRGAREITVIVP